MTAAEEEELRYLEGLLETVSKPEFWEDREEDDDEEASEPFTRPGYL